MKTRSVVCTLFENHYHYGVGAWINSLYKHGYRGMVYVGFRGVLPPWAVDLKDEEGYLVYTPCQELTVRFVRLETDIHFTAYKPAWMRRIIRDYEPDAESIFYFDPDIVINCGWAFFEEWAESGITLCQDVNGNMPADHPVRLHWKKYLDSQGYSIQRDLNVYFNAGFLGVPMESFEALEIWETLIDKSVERDLDVLNGWPAIHRTDWSWAFDQDTMNMMAMATPCSISTMGPEAMDFVPGGRVMSHAIGSFKPWNKPFLRCALKGEPPTRADKAYWQYVETPITLYSGNTLSSNRFRLKAASALGRFIRRG